MPAAALPPSSPSFPHTHTHTGAPSAMMRYTPPVSPSPRARKVARTTVRALRAQGATWLHRARVALDATRARYYRAAYACFTEAGALHRNLVGPRAGSFPFDTVGMPYVPSLT